MKTSFPRVLSILAAGILGNTAAVHADVLPPSQDSSSLKGKLTAVTGKAVTLSVNATRTGFIKFDLAPLPADITATGIAHARLRIYFPRVVKPGNLIVVPATQPWTELTTTAEPTVDVNYAKTIPAASLVGKKFVEIDITNIVQAWRGGTLANHGVAIVSDGTSNVVVGAKEGPGSGYPAELDIEVDRTNGSFNFDANDYNLFFGLGAGEANAGSAGNTAVGFNALHNSTAENNTAFGTNALGANTSGAGNTALGSGAGAGVTTGANNLVLGSGAGTGLATGSGNVVLGAGAGVNTDGSNNILLGHAGVAGESGTIRIGTDGTHTKTLLAGNVGIGTSSPTQAKLVVSGSGASHQLGNHGLLGAALVPAVYAGLGPYTSTDASIYADGAVEATVYRAFSDARIKNIQGRSDATADLRTLGGIEITNYTYKDFLTKGTGVQKKVIAQQLEQVFPQAVSRKTDVVPDIFHQATIQDGWVQLATNLKVGERVRLIAGETEGVHEVLEVQKDGFRTAFRTVGQDVFVYGREVQDFRVVDYEAISMLNVSATQELQRLLAARDAEVTKLRAAATAAEAKLAALEARDRENEARLARLEAALEAPAAHPVRAILRAK